MRSPKFKLASLCLGTFLLTSHVNTAQAACSPDVYMGSICFMAGNFCPKGFVEANGAYMQVATEQALFSLLSNTFGGNGVSSFALPDLRGRSAVMSGDGSSVGTPISWGQRRGSQILSLTENQLAYHNHRYEVQDIFLSGSLKASNSSTLSGSPEGNYLAATVTPAAAQYAPSGTTVPMAGNTVSGTFDASKIPTTEAVGNGSPFPIEGPRLGLTACIATGKNLYPPRN